MPFDVRKSECDNITIIRAASGHELSNYEKNKLATVEINAQENKIESIKLGTEASQKRLQIDKASKEVSIVLGDLAFKNKLAPEDLSTDKTVWIKCELTEEDLQVVSK